MTMSHTEIEELLGAYALDAVDPDEAEVVELHLRECPRCRDEVAAHRQTAALLGAHSGADAPAGVWDRITGSLTEAPPSPARTLPFAPPGSTRRRRLLVPALAGAMAAAAVVVALLGITIARQNNRLDRLSLNQAATAALVNPSAHRVRLADTSGSTTVDAVVLPDGRGYVVRDSLPALQGDRTYQLWSLDDGKPVSLGVLGRHPGVVEFRAGHVPSKMAITAENGSKGVKTPEHPPIVIGVVAA
ncbi:MAG: anti-sigma factor [Actinobacteria bacterium]|nr:anti-sigma factor [Actinomycetota bacterium]MBV9255270.1 anti-sigma factor [Actinomycetota bacterium]MBV9664664.1 anti-sigma factor [Actinomycetota bacterium]